MLTSIALDAPTLERLDLAIAESILQVFQGVHNGSLTENCLTFAIDYPQEPGDPREWSEIPEIRLWFIRLDARYPWLPFFLDWKGGELGRYVAMLVPHQFHPTEGIQYNPEALEIWVMQRVFLLHGWLQNQGIEGKVRIKSMTQLLGYELDDGFFELLA